MENTTVDAHLSNDTLFTLPSGPNALMISLDIISTWIILSNGLVLLCLVLSRHALKNFVNLQILSLSATDILVGLSMIPVTLTFQIAKSFQYFGICAFVLYGYGAAQHATMHHAFVICIYRLLTIKRCRGRSETNPRGVYRALLIQASIPWVESLVYVSIPFFVFGRHGKVIKACSMNEIFEDDYINAMIMFNVNLLIPHIGMNVIYIYVLVFLLRKWKRIDVLLQRTGPPPTTSGTTHSSQPGSAEMKTGTTTVSTPSKISSADNSTNKRQVVNLTIGRFGKDTTNQSVADKGNLLTCRNRHKMNEASTNQQPRNDGKLGIRGQRDVLITIGLLLLVLNVFMTPITFFAVAEVFNVDPLSRKAKFILLLFPLMNSVLNPFIYIFRIRPFREALRELWKKMCAKFGM